MTSKHQSTCFQLQKRVTLPHCPLCHKQSKDLQAVKNFLCVNCPTSHTSYTKQRAICTSSDELEASIDLFTVTQEGNVARHPPCHEHTKDSQVNNFLFVMCPTLHTSCMKQCAICSSNNESEASIDLFIVAQEDNVAPLPFAP